MAIRTTAPSTSSSKPTLRLVPPPDSAPPYDDELGVARVTHPPTQGALALDFRLRSGVAAIPEPPAQLRLIVDEPAPPPAADGDDDVDTFCARQPTPTSTLPDPKVWIARLSQATIEVLAGVRPLTQLSPWLDERVYSHLGVRLKAASRRSTAPRLRAKLRTVRICLPADGVVEASAVVQYGPRCRAMALRLEGLDGRWRCTELTLV